MSEQRPQPRPKLGQLFRRLLTGGWRSQLVVGLLVGLLGFAAVTQVRQSRASDAYAGLRQSDLVQILTGLTAQAQRTSSELNALRRTRTELQSSSQRRLAALRHEQDQASTLGILAGTEPAVGPGIRVTVSMSNNLSSLNDLLDAVEELRAAGAEAMEFNDRVRVVAQSWFDVGPKGVVVDGHALTSPYVLDVIGDPDTLSKGLSFAGGFVTRVDNAGGNVQIQRLDRVEVRSLVAGTAPHYAHVAPGQ